MNETIIQTLEQYLGQYAPLNRMYIEGIIQDVRDEYDHMLGISHDPSIESFTIGNQRINFQNSVVLENPGNKLAGPDFQIKNILYKGFFELLFKKNSIGFKATDDILIRTTYL